MNYLDNTWRPVPHDVISDKQLKSKIDGIGFDIVDKISSNTIEELKGLFFEHHNIKDSRGGMFYSVYSQDNDYRKKIHNGISSILSNELDTIFKDYRTMLGSFVVKYPGPQSEFALHQDGTGLDEFKHSPVNIWIPLDDVDENNGALALIPHSHKFFSPYRHVSFPTPFVDIQPTVRQYLKIQKMKKGETLIFDNRMLHNSVINNTDKPRIAVVCGIFPKEAKLMTVCKPEHEYYNKVELIEHDDSFLLTHPNFLIDCHIRPDTGTSIGWKDDKYGPISAKEFEQLCERFGVKKVQEVGREALDELNLIGEHDHNFPKKKGVIETIKSFIS